MNSPLYSLEGNEEVKRFLTQMIEKERVAHSLLFAGPEGVGKSDFAMAFAQALICRDDPRGSHAYKISQGSHPDIRIYRPEGKVAMHSIDSMRQLQDELYLVPYEAKWKIFIIHDADRMLPASANALLKSFEEPPLDSVIILLSSAPENILGTIRSRCRHVQFKPTAEMQAARQIKEHHTHEILLPLLTKGAMASYLEIKETADKLDKELAKTKEALATEARDREQQIVVENRTAAQTEQIEKEVDGFAMLAFLHEVEAALHFVLCWFRDMEVISLVGKENLLFLPEHHAAIEQAVQRGELQPLEKVQKLVGEAKLSAARFMPLSAVFETFFLKLTARA